MNRTLPPRLPTPAIVESPATTRVFALARLYAPAASIAIIVGETGTGKSHLARWMHAIGPRAGRPFVDVTAAELSETLAQAQLFGYEPGAFTGAVGRSAGLFERAADGTLLLDDFHLLPLSVQAMLLRALSSGVYRPLNADRDLPIRCRIIVGLRDCPDTLMRDGKLLPDLRYRLGHCILRLVPLAQRREEIQPLAELFLKDCPRETGVAGPSAMAPDVVPALEAAPWAGNVRDLRATVEAAYLHAQGEPLVRFDHLPDHARVTPQFQPRGDRATNERAIAWALFRSRNRVDVAARLIGAHRNTVSSYVATRRSERDAAAAHSSPAPIVHGEQDELITA